METCRWLTIDRPAGCVMIGPQGEQLRRLLGRGAEEWVVVRGDYL